MINVTADGSMQALLTSFTDETVIRDDKGNLLGYFAPSKQARALLFEKVKASIDPVELKRRQEAEHGQGLPISEVMKRLEALGASE